MDEYRVGYLVEDGDQPLAVFLDSAPDCNAGNLRVYARLGEHGEAAISYLRGLSLAGEPQYRDLHEYLSRRYAGGPGESLRLVIDQDGAPRR